MQTSQNVLMITKGMRSLVRACVPDCGGRHGGAWLHGCMAGGGGVLSMDSTHSVELWTLHGNLVIQPIPMCSTSLPSFLPMKVSLPSPSRSAFTRKG